MIESTNSPQRIKGLLPPETIVAHKTGTGGEDDLNRRSACNDVGIITLPNGNHVALTVFVSLSKETYENDEKKIAERVKLYTIFMQTGNKMHVHEEHETKKDVRTQRRSSNREFSIAFALCSFFFIKNSWS